jgi:hypothetical protein
VTIIRVGATKQYSTGWEAAFGKGKKQSASVVTAKKSSKKAAVKTSAKKKSAKKGKK